MAEKSVMDQLQSEALTIRDHLDPDKHWIGESLGIPTQSEIAATVGTVSTPGESPFVARADHQHKLDGGIFPTYDFYSSPGTDDATTGTAFAVWITMPSVLTIPSWAKNALVQLNLCNIESITAACKYALNLTIGATAVGTTDYSVIDFTVAGQSREISFAKDVVLTGTGTQSIVIYARRISGTGTLRATTLSQLTTVTFYKP
jgi:hypothetical protein